ncbi:MAG: DUF1533 domain-containing protein [Ignavibacteriales bacterium]|nr:DUF1533 domain-containing protein [Ignavibacteriales bacterium]
MTATAKDQYNNLVPGYIFKYDATVTNTDVTRGESYTIDGTARTSTANDVDVVAVTNASGVATFTIAVPSGIDQGDGLSVQVQLANGSSNTGSAFSITGLNPLIDFAGTDPTTNAFSVNSINNILYRVGLTVSRNPATLTGAEFTVIGSFVASDIGTDGYKVYYSANSTLEPGTDELLASLAASNDTEEQLNFAFSKALAVGSGYLFLTVDVDQNASVGNNISINTPTPIKFAFTSAVATQGSFAAPKVHIFAGAAPTLTADGTNNTVDNDIDITFTDDATWRAAITAVKVNGTSLDAADYTISAGNLKLKPSIGNALLTTSGAKQ